MSFCENPKKIYTGGRAVFKGCGKCRLCRSRTSRELALRFQKDVDCWRACYGYDSDTYFVTLTYDFEHIHVVDDPGSKKAYNYLKDKHFTACKADLMKYKERIRSQLFRDLKRRVPLIIVSSTEYGDEFHRPHCHLVIHGIPSTYKDGKVEKMCEFFSSKWTDENGQIMGFVQAKICDSGSVIYTADYASSGSVEEDLPSVCEAPCVQYSKGIGSRYFSRNVGKLKELGGIPSVIKTADGKQKSVLLPYPRYFIRKYITCDKKFKREHYKESLKKRAVDLTIKYGVSHCCGSYDDFVEASYKLYSVARILDKLNRRCRAELYLMSCPLLEDTWTLCRGRGKFNCAVLFASPLAKKRFCGDYKRFRDTITPAEREAGFAYKSVVGLYNVLYELVLGKNTCCQMYMRDVVWCIEHKRVCRSGRLFRLRDAYCELYERFFSDFVGKYYSYIDLFEKEYKYRCDASVQKMYDVKSKKKGVL